MSALDRFRGRTITETADPAARAELAETRLRQEQETNLLLEESIADLQLALEDTGWARLASQGQAEFTRDGLTRLVALCRLMAIANPLIKRGLNLRGFYVWGQGVSVSARSSGPSNDNADAQDVNAVVQAFLDDDGTREALTGEQAREENERALGTDGNMFFALFTSPLTGRVQPRVLPFEQMVDKITNPDDSSDVWFYLRKSQARTLDPVTFAPRFEAQEAYYPALGYRPPTRAKNIGDKPVHWDSPVLHVRVNGQRGWAYGIPDAYAAIAWARAYKEFLEDWAKLVKALSRYAYRLTSTGSKARRDKLAAAVGQAPSLSTLTGVANDVGATAVTNAGTMLEPVPKTGATIDSQSGKPLAGMVAAALDVPVTMLLADPGVTGARATAETLDRPTELMAGSRRGLWTAALRRILAYVVTEAVRAPRGPLQGSVVRDRLTGDEVLTIAGDTESTVDISWPDLDEVSTESAMKAIQVADQMDKIPPLVLVRLALEALGVSDVDEILKTLVDDQGNFVPPAVTAGDVAVAAFARDHPDASAAPPAPPAAPPPVQAREAAPAPEPQPIHVTVEPPNVDVHIEGGGPRSRRVERDQNGDITRIVEES